MDRICKLCAEEMNLSRFFTLVYIKTSGVEGNLSFITRGREKISCVCIFYNYISISLDWMVLMFGENAKRLARSRSNIYDDRNKNSNMCCK